MKLPLTARRHPLRRATVVLALILVTVTALTACVSGRSAPADPTPGVLSIGMTASDVPNLDTVLSGGQGYEGYRFVGNQLYDSLTRFNLKQGDHTPEVVPGLAASWQTDAAKTTWTFQLRRGVKFTDGTPFNADAVIYNLNRYLNKEAPQYDASVAGQAALTLGGVASYRKIDDQTIAIGTNGVYSHLPEDLVFVYMASPTALQKYGKDFGQHPVGTGPYKLDKLTRGQQVSMVPNKDYWGGSPKIDHLVLKAIPDVSTRLAALRSGEVNWIEAPNPDDIKALAADGYQVLANSYDHVWPWIFDTTKGPLQDVRVRRALNLGINRDAMVNSLLAGTADPALQTAPTASLAYHEQNNAFGYQPDEAKALMAQAGYPRGFTMSVSYPTGGSGNMQPSSMNQQLQSDLAKIGVTVELKPIEWATMLTSFSAGEIPDNADAINISLTFIQEAFWGLLFGSESPSNVGHYSSPVVDELAARSLEELDPLKRADIYAQIGAQVDKDAAWLDVVNDRNPRVLAPSVHGFVQPKSWFVDLTTVSVD